MTKKESEQKDSFENYGILKTDLPNSNTVLILGILSIISCFCIGIVGIVLGIIAMYLYKKPAKLYQLAPELYTKSSFKNLKTGHATAIIGLVFSTISLIISFIYYFLFGGFIIDLINIF